MTIADALRDATMRLGTDWARDEAEMLMAHALGTTRSAMLLGHMREPSPEGFASLLARRLNDEPVAYILGETEFYGRRFEVGRGVLIPRGDSETLVAAVLEACPSPRRVLDCGVGSGCLLLTVMAETGALHGVGVDRSAEAIEIASANATALHIRGELALGQDWAFHLLDWTQPGWAIELGTFDLVIANPPYVEDDAELDASVRDFEPAGALFAGPDGLDAYRVLIPQLPALLNPGGVAVLEIGWRQAEAVSTLAHGVGLTAVLRHDLAGRPRALILARGNPA